MTIARGGGHIRTASQSLAVVLLWVITGACGGGARDGAAGDTPTEPADGSVGAGEVVEGVCLPVEPALADSGASLSGMAGAYHLTLESSGTPPTSSEGTLTLETLPDTLQEMGGARTPLGGSTDVDVEAVGALRLGDLGSDDPAAPGVLVIETDGPSIILRLGSEPNRRDQVAFDGGYTVLTVHQIGADGFDGSWRSGSGVVVNEGYFCARGIGTTNR